MAALKLNKPFRNCEHVWQIVPHIVGGHPLNYLHATDTITVVVHCTLDITPRPYTELAII